MSCADDLSSDVDVPEYVAAASDDRCWRSLSAAARGSLLTARAALSRDALASIFAAL